MHAIFVRPVQCCLFGWCFKDRKTLDLVKIASLTGRQLPYLSTVWDGLYSMFPSLPLCTLFWRLYTYNQWQLVEESSSKKECKVGDYNYMELTPSLPIRLAFRYKEEQDIKALIDSSGQHSVSAAFPAFYKKKRSAQWLWLTVGLRCFPWC